VSSGEIHAKGKPVIVRFARACLCNSRAVEREGAVCSLKNILVAAAVTGRNNFYCDFGTSRISFLLLLLVHALRTAPNAVREGMQTRRNCVCPRGWLTKVGGLAGWTHLVGSAWLQVATPRACNLRFTFLSTFGTLDWTGILSVDGRWNAMKLEIML